MSSNNNEKNGRIKMNPQLFITIIVLTGSIVASYFTGLAQSKEYTDEKIEKSSEKIMTDQKEMKQDLTTVKVDMAVIKQILVQVYGTPKCDPEKENCNK